MKISAFYYNVLRACEETGKSLEEILNIFKAEGLSALEFNCMDVTEEISEILDKVGLGISSLYRSVRLSEGIELEKGMQLVEKAAQLGCKNVMVVPGIYPEDSDMEEAKTRIYDGLSKIAAYSEQKQIRVTIEDFDCERTTLGSAEDMHWYGSRIPNLYYTFDTGNFSDLNCLQKHFHVLKHKIVHVHCKDYTLQPIFTQKVHISSSGTRLYGAPFGCGMLPSKEILQWLKAIRYDGYLNIEQTNADNHMNAVLNALKWLKENGW